MEIRKVSTYEVDSFCCDELCKEFKIGRVNLKTSSPGAAAPYYFGVLGDDPMGWVLFKYCPFCGAIIERG